MPDPVPNQPADAPGTITARPASTKFLDRLSLILPQLGVWLAAGAIIILGLGIVVMLVAGLFVKSSIVRELANVDLARGVITFIFAVGTIGIALLLTLGALLGSHTVEVFAKAKEVLTVLIGVFGTILGFYFGTAEKSGGTVEIAEMKLTDTSLITHVAGGIQPYRYSITSDDPGIAPIKNRISDDGWVVETLAKTPKPGAVLTLEVSDSKDKKGSRKLDIPGAAKASPTASPQKSETPGTRPPATPTVTGSPPAPTDTASPAR